MEQIVVSVPKIPSSDHRHHPVPPDQRLAVFKSNKVLAAIIILSNYLHGNGGNSIHGRSASPLFLRGYDLSGITTLLSALIKRAYSSPKDTLKAFNEDIHKVPDIDTDILNEIYNVYNTLSLNYLSSSPSPLSSSPSLSQNQTLVQSQSQSSIEQSSNQSQSSIEPSSNQSQSQSQSSSSPSQQQKPTSPSLSILSPPSQQKPSSPKSSTSRVKTRRSSGRYLLWEKPPASFSPYVNTLKLSFLSSTSASPQPFTANTTTTINNEEGGNNNNDVDDEEDDSFIKRVKGGSDNDDNDDDNDDSDNSLSPDRQREDSFMGCLCTRVLLILKGFFCDFSTVKSCILEFKKDDIFHFSAADPLLDLLFLTPDRSGDSALQLVHMEALSALESFFVTASLSRPLLERLATMRVVERLTDAISLQSAHAASTVSNRAIALLAQLLCTSSRLTPALVRAFRTHGGYNVLRGAFAAELDRTRGGNSSRNRRRRKELLKVLHLLLYVGLDEPGNLDAIRLLVRLYVDSTDSFKSDLLSTLKGAAHIQNERGGSSILIEIFKLFDSVPSVEDRMSLLRVVDETMGLRNAGNSLLTAYCSLMDKGRRPSTVVLAANHITRMLVTGMIPKESLETVDFLSVLHPYFVPPNELPFKKVNIQTRNTYNYISF